MEKFAGSIPFEPFVKRSVKSAIHDRRTEIRDGLSFTYVNKPEFDEVYKEVFEGEEWGPFNTTNPSPSIIDCGAHIGLASLYFKKKFPGARISAVEPDPLNFMLLMINIMENGLHNVTLDNNAVGVQRETLRFHVQKPASDDTPRWTWGNSVVEQWTDEAPHDSIPIPSVPLSHYLDEPVDLLKLDIEGYEREVLAGICKEGSIKNVGSIAMDFHGGGPSNAENTPESITDLLEGHGFEHTIYQDGNPRGIDAISRIYPYWLIIHARRSQL
jgi:FkbM family methyltransferase